MAIGNFFGELGRDLRELGGDIKDGAGWVWDQTGGRLGSGMDRGKNEFRTVDPEGNLGSQSRKAGSFADRSQTHFGQLGAEATSERQRLRDIAEGRNSISAEQLRQALQQNVAAQQSMAAGARPGNAAMAARTASMQAARMGSGLAGQQAVAGIAERQAAAQSLANMLMQQRQQELQAALQSRGQAIQGFGDIERARANRFGALTGTPTGMESLLGAGMGAAQLAMIASDRRLKEDIDDGDADAQALLEGLKAYSYRYKNDKHGKGKQLGIMAQDLERVAPHAVVDTDEGKMVHGAKLAGALAAALPGLHKRISRLEEGK